jgi:ABC-type lipoprotein release transport system permease subunit
MFSSSLMDCGGDGTAVLLMSLAGISSLGASFHDRWRHAAERRVPERRRSVVQRRCIRSIFGTAALLLAAVGLYAVMAAYVRQREIGIRVAIGATASDIRRLVMTEGLRLVGVGAAIGVATAMTATRILRGLLFQVAPNDPVTMAAATLVLVGVSAIASYLPARRATRVDPIAVLKTL